MGSVESSVRIGSGASTGEKKKKGGQRGSIGEERKKTNLSLLIFAEKIPGSPWRKKKA